LSKEEIEIIIKGCERGSLTRIGKECSLGFAHYSGRRTSPTYHCPKRDKKKNPQIVIDMFWY
jgi:hypothetical protein